MNDSYGQLSLGHSFRAEWAKRLVLSRIAEFYNSRPQDDIVREKLPELGAVEPGKLPTLPETKPDREADPTGYKVCIIGAGAAGLFTAMTIDYLNEMVPDLNFSYDILEAADETRFGGRLYTHRFSEALHDYYDVGAMRFPDIPIMKRHVPRIDGFTILLTLATYLGHFSCFQSLASKCKITLVLECPRSQ